jgi:glucokinase
VSEAVFAIDIGGTQLRAAIIGRDGQIIAKQASRTHAQGGREAILVQITDLCRGLRAAHHSQTIIACGIACPGPLDSGTGVVLNAPNFRDFTDVPLRDEIAKRLSLPTRLENDGIAAAIGEWKHGAGLGSDHLVFLTISTGIGGGVIADGRVLRGRRGMAAHIGHLITDPASGLRCPCGAIGCFEALACGPALERRLRANKPLCAAIGKPEPDARDLFRMARAGDPEAVALVDQEADYLALGITSALHAYSPERVLIGGGVGSNLPQMLDRMRAGIARTAMPHFRDVPVMPAALGDNAGLVGAAALAFDPTI